jgi:ABC-type branched-subunit amino acid transport system ATPase component
MSEKKLGDYIITVDNVSKTFLGGIQAVKNFTTNISRSEVLVIMGPSGRGSRHYFAVSTDWRSPIAVLLS